MSYKNDCQLRATLWLGSAEEDIYDAKNSIASLITSAFEAFNFLELIIFTSSVNSYSLPFKIVLKSSKNLKQK